MQTVIILSADNCYNLQSASHLEKDFIMLHVGM